MKAIVRFEYGSPDVLQLQDIDTPVVKADQVLVRVHAAGVNMADVDHLRGQPAVARLITGLRRPRNRGLCVGSACLSRVCEGRTAGGWPGTVRPPPRAMARNPTAPVLAFERAGRGLRSLGFVESPPNSGRYT